MGGGTGERVERQGESPLGLQGAVVEHLVPPAAREQGWSKGSAARKELQWALSLLPVPVSGLWEGCVSFLTLSSALFSPTALAFLI